MLMNLHPSQCIGVLVKNKEELISDMILLQMTILSVAYLFLRSFLQDILLICR